MNWQVQALVETLGALRGHLAHLSEKHERERAELAQKLEAAKDALSKQEANGDAHKRELARQTLEVERLRRELATALRERDEARSQLDKEEVT